MCTADELDAFLDAVPEDVVVVVDEAYAEYIDDPSYPNGPALVRTRPNVAVLRTFSKLYGLAGLRIGYVIGPLWLADAVNALRHWYDVSDAAILAASASLRDPAEVTRRQQITREARGLLVTALAGAGLKPLPSVGPFVVVPVDDADRLAEGFLRHAVVVRPYPHANGTFIRIAVGGDEDLRQVRAALVALSDEGLLI
jgi:histidinol-phosphate aminotransferase